MWSGCHTSFRAWICQSSTRDCRVKQDTWAEEGYSETVKMSKNKWSFGPRAGSVVSRLVQNKHKEFLVQFYLCSDPLLFYYILRKVSINSVFYDIITKHKNNQSNVSVAGATSLSDSGAVELKYNYQKKSESSGQLKRKNQNIVGHDKWKHYGFWWLPTFHK